MLYAWGTYVRYGSSAAAEVHDVDYKPYEPHYLRADIEALFKARAFTAPVPATAMAKRPASGGTAVRAGGRMCVCRAPLLALAAGPGHSRQRSAGIYRPTEIDAVR